MIPAQLPQANLILRAPPDMPDCGDLYVFRYPQITVPGHPELTAPGGYISCWQPTEEERAAIAAGGPVWVNVVGVGPPPPIGVEGLSPLEGAVGDGDAWLQERLRALQAIVDQAPAEQ